MIPTLKQKRLARKIKNISESPLVGVKYTSKKALLADVGYSSEYVRVAAKSILESEGLRLALAEEGISLDNADRVVNSILNVPVKVEDVTPDNQLRASDFIARRLGGYAPEKIEIRKVIAKISFNVPSVPQERTE